MTPTTFSGFPEDAINFLNELETNNNRDWFNANKQRYTEHLQTPAIALVEALGSRLQERISENIVYDTSKNGSGSLMRIYRDTRFSKDKTPYKTNLALVFWEGSRKKMLNPIFGLQISADKAELMTGVHGMDKDMLARYRDAVVDDSLGGELLEAVKTVKAKGDYAINGPHYKRPPKGYTLPDDERSAYLLHNGLYAYSPEIDAETVKSAKLADVVMTHFENMAAIHQWLVSINS